MRHRCQSARRDDWGRYTARHHNTRARRLGFRTDEPGLAFSLPIVRPGSRALFRLLRDTAAPAGEGGRHRHQARRPYRARPFGDPLAPAYRGHPRRARQPAPRGCAAPPREAARHRRTSRVPRNCCQPTASDRPFLDSAGERASRAQRDHGLHGRDTEPDRRSDRGANHRPVYNRRKPDPAAVRRDKVATPSADFGREDAGQRLRLVTAGVLHHGDRHRTRPYVRQRRGNPERISSNKDRRTARGQGGSTTSCEVIMATVLVVDDEFGIVDVLETILTDEGYRVVTACNGKQGLVRLSAEEPDVILLDFMMPILGGAEMLRAMAAEPAYQRIPVIMISSLAEDVIAEKCKGYAAFLLKPFRAAAVLSTVARVLGSGANAAA